MVLLSKQAAIWAHLLHTPGGTLAVERQRRFTVAKLPTDDTPTKTEQIRQVYWRLGGDWCVRLRQKGEAHELRQELGLKGPRADGKRPEFEFSLFSGLTLDEQDEALQSLLSLHEVGEQHKIVKTRYTYEIDGLTWEVDEFKDKNDGLIIAELELVDSNEEALTEDAFCELPVPKWVEKEVTAEADYNNENLAYRPFSSWV
jgi:CYTH domain-containing protein